MTQLYTDPFGPPWRCNWMRLLFKHWRGSIFQFFWVEWIFATAVCAFSLMLWYLLLRDGARADRLDILAGLLYIVEYIVSRFQAALSLMLGFYTGTIYNRWWKIRDVEGVVIGRINDIAPQIAAMVRDNELPSRSRSRVVSEEVACKGGNEEEKKDSLDGEKGEDVVTDAAQVRMHLVRWLNLSHALAIGELYEKQPNEFASLDHLVDTGLLTEDERQYMDKHPRSRYVAPFVWFLDLVHELRDRGECGISESSIIIMADNITRIRGSLADLYMYRNVPVPLSYRQLVNWTVRMYMVILALAGGLSSVDTVNLADADGTLSIHLTINSGIFWFLLDFFFEYFMFVGWLSLADALGNPFRTWADEFEWENYVRSVCLSSEMFVTRTRAASPGTVNLQKMTEFCELRQEKARKGWAEEVGKTDRSRILRRGLEEALCAPDHEKAKEGFTKVRYNLTGF